MLSNVHVHLMDVCPINIQILFPLLLGDQYVSIKIIVEVLLNNVNAYWMKQMCWEYFTAVLMIFIRINSF